MSFEPDNAVVEPWVQTVVRPRRQHRHQVKQQPRYQVILWDDNEHSYAYVIQMMQELFGYTRVQGFKIASAVDQEGRAVCLTTTKEHAELKRDQIHAYGKDPLSDQCLGSMWSTIEPLC